MGVEFGMAQRTRAIMRTFYVIEIEGSALWMRSSGRKIAPSRRSGPGSNIRSGHQAGVRLCQGALSRAQQEHPPSAGDLRFDQFVHSATPSAALRTGVLGPQPGGQTIQIPQCAIKTAQLPVPSPDDEIATPLIQIATPYSDKIGRLTHPPISPSYPQKCASQRAGHSAYIPRLASGR